MKDAKELIKCTKQARLKGENDPLDKIQIEEVYENFIYPLLLSSALNGNDTKVISKWELSNILPCQCNIFKMIEYIRTEKKITVHIYGDVLSFSW